MTRSKMLTPATALPPSQDALPPRSPAAEDAWVVGLVGAAHLVSHFSQLLLAPLFPWLHDEFHVSYAELGALMSVFFVVSCVVQALAGFVVDRFGPRPVLFGGLALLGLSALGFAASTRYADLAVVAALAGVGNGVFHPADFTLLNRKINPIRLGHAFSAHGITGSLGWALAPALLVPVARVAGWRAALYAAALVIGAVLLLLWVQRARLTLAPLADAASTSAAKASAAAPTEGALAFLRLPAVWICFAFFFFYAMALSGVQTFAPEAARQLHALPVAWMAACLTAYMVASAAGMVVGGFLVGDAAHCERIIAIGFGVSSALALLLGYVDVPAAAVPVLFGAMGFGAGLAGPSRDLIVKRAAPPHATGRVYGVVYAGLDIGQAVAPLGFGTLMDHHQPAAVWLGIAGVQLFLIANAFNVGRVRRDRHLAVAT